LATEAGYSRLLRRGYIAANEHSIMEMHASRWYFFFGPVFWLIVVLVGCYYAASGMLRGFPQLPFLPSLIARPVIPGAGASTGIALFLMGLFLSLAALSILWGIKLIPSIGWGVEHGNGAAYRVFGRLGAGLLFLFSIVVGYCAASGAFSVLPALPFLTRGFAGLHSSGVRATPLLADPLLGLFVALTIAALLWMLYRWVEWTQDSYVVTDDRLIKQHRDWTPLGWTYVSREMLIRQIRDVDVHQDRLLWKMLNCGTLEIHSLSEPETTRLSRELAYLNPRNPRIIGLDPEVPGNRSIDEFPGVEWWFCIPRPVRVQREILQVNSAIERGQHPTD
jgi:hypothetical protein